MSVAVEAAVELCVDSAAAYFSKLSAAGAGAMTARQAAAAQAATRQAQAVFISITSRNCVIPAPNHTASKGWGFQLPTVIKP